MEQESFDRAAQRWQDMVFRLALHQLGSYADADDAVQEVFLRLWRQKAPFESEEHLRRWLLRVTVNWCRDQLRSPWRQRRVDWDSLENQPAFETPEQGELYQAVMSLPEKYRTVLDLFYYEELSVREIGEVLGLSQSAVTTRLSRARKLLRERWEAWQDDE